MRKWRIWSSKARISVEFVKNVIFKLHKNQSYFDVHTSAGGCLNEIIDPTGQLTLALLLLENVAMLTLFITCFLSLLSPSESRKQPLQPCEKEVELTATLSESDEAESSSSLSSCTSQREEEAALHHQLVLQKPDYTQKISLKCPICSGESTTSFTWYFLPRGNSPIFKSKNGQISLISPGGKPLTQDMFSGNAIPCFINKTNDLFIPKFNRDVHAGTYYCRNVEDRTHLANFIWYHLDVILPPDSEGLVTSISKVPAHLEGEQKVSQLSDVNVIMKSAGSYLRNDRNSTDYLTPLINITYRVTATPKPSQTCGTFTIRRFKQCYVTIPRNLNSEAKLNVSADMLITYELLRSTFESFYTWVSEENPTVRITQRKAAETRASELGFELFYDDKAEEEPEEGEVESEEYFLSLDVESNQHYYIPCHFTYLKHVNLTGELPRPFDMKNVQIEVTFKIPCPEVDHMDIINLALASKDTKALKQTILGYEEKRYMKLERVAIRGTKNLELLCGGEGDTFNYNCSDKENQTILWKQERGE